MPGTPPSGFPPFQFHKGTIKTGGASSGGGALWHFNSIKVRLKPENPVSKSDREIISIP